MEFQNENQIETSELPRKESRVERSTPDYPMIKVQLPKEAALRVQATLQVLRERKSDTKVDDLLSEFLNSIGEDYLENQVEKRTPEDYYFEAARNIPELREKIIQQAKKALQKTDKIQANSLLAEPRRTKKKDKTEEIQVNSGDAPQPQLDQLL